MPIFELDRGQPVLAKHLTPAASAFGAESSALVADHLDALLGEQFMPVASRQPGVDSPHLLAVDASGQPVVVEVVHRLDGDALLRALKYGGQAARLSSRDLASLYHRGADQFEADLAEFSAGVPVVARHVSVRHAGSRLLLVCAEAEPGVLDAIEFLRQPGWHVDVLQIGVLGGADGRRFVDVSPLVRVRAGGARTSHTWLAPARPPQTEHTGPRLAAPAFSSAAPVAVPAPAPGPAARPTPALFPPLTPDPGIVISPILEQSLASLSPAARARLFPLRSPPVGTSTRGPIEIPASSPPGEGPAGPGSAREFPSVLAMVASRVPTPATLVWVRQRRGQRLEAKLRLDGVIVTAGGVEHEDPNEAAAASSGSLAPLDGWRVWRVGEDGPSLAELRDR